jgi:hypothetical protein
LAGLGVAVDLPIDIVVVSDVVNGGDGATLTQPADPNIALSPSIRPLPSVEYAIK